MAVWADQGPQQEIVTGLGCVCDSEPEEDTNIIVL